ncbi:MAG: hypothetical protein DRP74_06400 [Candidatus Omnitrophota bacterium]|nr:MAG: hypothetical protein DRP74_06400 [Candidatus Omnitrophota bacterium]
MPDSNTIVLEILKEGNNLSLSIYGQREFASTLRHYSRSPATMEQIEHLCHEITYLLNKVDKNGNLEAQSISALKKTGQLLWDGILTSAVKERLKNCEVKDLVLSIDEELIDIPWELLYDGKDFFCFKFNLGRVVRTRERINPVEYRSSGAPLKMLILANPTNDLKSAYSEGVNIKNQFDRKRKEMSIDFKSTQIDSLYVKKNLRDYDIVHFAGHCEYDKSQPQNSGWVLSDAKFTARDIVAMAETLSLPSLIFSNACYSASIKENFLMDEDYQRKTYSLAWAFLFSGVRHYIGSICRIEDPVSLVFAKEFYAQMISGKSVGESIRSARQKLIQDYGASCIYWAAYLLYGDPSFVFFAKKRSVLAQAKGKILYRKILKRSLVAASAAAVLIWLYLWLPSINPNTYILYAKSKKLFSQGKNESVISICQEIIQKEPLFLRAYPLLADTYYRIGDKGKALDYYFQYSRACEKKGDRKSLSSAYLGIGWIYLLQGEYPKSLDFYNKAITLSQENNDKLIEARALERMAVWHIDKENYDKALELLMKSSEINRQRQHIYEHKYGLACDYFDIGLVFINKDDYQAAREFYNKSLLLFEKMKLYHELSDCYFNIGEVCLYEKKYQEALDNYMKGLSLDRQHGNQRNIASDYNMIGELYVEMDNLAEAEKFFHQSVVICRQIEAPVEEASAYSNLGLLYKQRKQKNKAREYLRRAQELYWRISKSEYEKIKNELLELSGNSGFE